MNTSDASLPVAMPVDHPQCAKQTRADGNVIANLDRKLDRFLLRPYLPVIERDHDFTGRRSRDRGDFRVHRLQRRLGHARLPALLSKQIAGDPNVVLRSGSCAADRRVVTGQARRIIRVQRARSHLREDRFIGCHRKMRPGQTDGRDYPTYPTRHKRQRV